MVAETCAAAVAPGFRKAGSDSGSPPHEGDKGPPAQVRGIRRSDGRYQSVLLSVELLVLEVTNLRLQVEDNDVLSSSRIRDSTCDAACVWDLLQLFGMCVCICFAAF